MKIGSILAAAGGILAITKGELVGASLFLSAAMLFWIASEK